MNTARWQTDSAKELQRALGISLAAAELYTGSEVVDLHVDSFIWNRVCGYRLDRRHTPGVLGGRFCRQVDVPRLRAAGVGSATWIVTTNPLRSLRSQLAALQTNLAVLRGLLTELETDVGLAVSFEDHRRIRQSGRHAAFLGVQGGNALAAGEPAFEALSKSGVLRVTLVHLSSSPLGQTSSPLRLTTRSGLSDVGIECVRELNRRKILVDLAHISEAGFFSALECHTRELPPVVTHTGVSAVYPHWRNLSDAQIRAIADRGGLIGIMYHTPFLGPGLRRGPLEWVVNHIEHVAKLVGWDFVALGSDWDGAIITPHDMPTCLELPRLVDALLRRGATDAQVHKLLGQNFLSLLRTVLPG